MSNNTNPVEINRKVEAYINYLKDYRQNDYNQSTVLTARALVVLVSISSAALIFLFSKEGELDGLRISSILFFSLEIILNAFFLIYSQDKVFKEIEFLQGSILEFRDKIYKDETEFTKERNVNEDEFKKYYSKNKNWFIRNNMYIQFGIWVLAIVLLLFGELDL